jgi:hypothetical protein
LIGFSGTSPYSNQAKWSAGIHDWQNASNRAPYRKFPGVPISTPLTYAQLAPDFMESVLYYAVQKEDGVSTTFLKSVINKFWG